MLREPTGAFPALREPTGAWTVLSDATAARLTAPAAGDSSLAVRVPSSPYGEKRRRRAGIAALALVVVLGVAAGGYLTRSRADSPGTAATTVPLAAGNGGAAESATCPPATTDLAAGGDTAPALWWPLDEGAGTIACDASGNDDTATLSSAAGWRGAAPQALSLTSATADSYASGSAPAVRTDRSFTVMGWVYLADTSASHGVLSQPGKVSSGFILKYDEPTDSWRLAMPRSDTAAPVVDGPSSTTKPALRTWTHLAARYDSDAGTITLFVDGRAEDTAGHPVAWNATGPVQVARSWYNGAWTDRFAGAITDVRAYQAALPPAEITALSKLEP